MFLQSGATSDDQMAPIQISEINEYVLVSIPLNESQLKDFRFDGEPPPAPGSRESKPRLYKHVAADESIRWNLAVHDVVSAAR